MKKQRQRARRKVTPLFQCNHYWSHPHSVWEGRRPSEVAVARYCSKCGKKQLAFASHWQNIPASYPDVREECTPNTQ